MAVASRASDIAELLLSCEGRVPTARYVTDSEVVVPIDSEGADVFVISDLHLAAGRRKDGRFAGTENFFSDDSFHRFLRYARGGAEAGKAILIINGDFIDFLRITEGPCEEEEFVAWQEILERIGIQMKVERLRESVSKREVKCEPRPRFFKSIRQLTALLGITPQGVGLKTHDYKSVWKLSAVVKGHPEFFEALAEWLDEGHRLIVVKGNHDLEWYWQAVRNCLRLTLAGRIAAKSSGDLDENINQALTQKVIPNVTFIDDGMVIDGHFYVEHGHRYDKYTKVLGGPVLKEGDELNIPFGSFLNRYLFNYIELDYAFLDNVRPTRNILPLLIRERFPLAIKLLVGHIPFLIRIIPKQYFDYMFRRVFLVGLAIALPLGILIWQQYDTIRSLLSEDTSPKTLGKLLGPVLSFVKNFAWLALSYIFARFIAYFQLEEPDTLAEDAREKFDKNPQYRLMTFGHTHNPDQVEYHGRWFYNTGTWIPIVEISSADIREDKTYTILHLRHGSSGRLEPGYLCRWNDEAGRLERAVLVKRTD